VDLAGGGHGAGQLVAARVDAPADAAVAAALARREGPRGVALRDVAAALQLAHRQHHGQGAHTGAF